MVFLFARKVLDNRMQRCGVTELLVPLGGTAGCVLGALTGCRSASQRSDGFLWRPILQGAVGGGVGVIMGCFWRQSIIGVVVVDVMCSLRKK